MTEASPIQKALNEILHTQSFDKLGDYSDQKVWVTLNQDERKLLAKLFVMAAESELRQPKTDDPIVAAKKSFVAASTLAPEDPQVWFQRGVAFSGNDDALLLEEASLCFEKALSLNATFFDALFAWASVLMRRGLISDDPNYYYLAVEKFEQAEALMPQSNELARIQGEFYWQYGFIHFLISRSSEEAVDLHKAIQHYRKAKSFGIESKELSNDLGNALVELALLINQSEMIYEAIELYLSSLEDEDKTALPHELAGRYFNLGSCYQYLFEMHHEESFFKQSEDCFTEATKLHSVFLPCWMHWANLLLYASKLWQDAEMLERAVEKFSEASEIAHEAPLLLIRWSEALCLLGSHEENLTLLQRAEQIAEEAVDKAPQMPESWAALGFVYYNLGRYFGDEKYYIQALEKLEYGLSLDQHIGTLWHLLAIVKFSYGEMRNDMRLLEEAILCFNWASKEEPARFGCFWNDWGIALLNVADITHDKQFVQEGIEKFEQAILCQEHPHPQWLINLGSALDFLGDLTDDETAYEKAIQILTHTLQMDPTSVSARYTLALSYSHLGEIHNDLSLFQKAIEELHKVIEQDPEDENAHNDLGLAYLHIALMNRQEIEKQVKESLFELSEQHFIQSISLGNQSAYYTVACLYALQGNFPDAIHYLQKAHESDVLPAVEDMLDDEWLDPMKNSAQFKEFIASISAPEQN